jgi:phenylalanyl-tRNA synthetase beta chain
VLLEAATFRGERIRRTRLRAGLVTDSATRFEKGLFPEYCPAALNRAIALLAEGCPGCRVTQRFIAGQTASSAKSIAFSPDAVRRLTGIDVAPDRQAELLARLGFAAQGGAVAVPWWRARNTSGPADLVEEIARLDGYHRIQPETPRLPAAAPPVNELRAAEHRVRRVLSALGWDEVATYAFTSEDWAKALGWGADAVRLAHPLSSEQTVLRLSLMPNLAEALGRNRKSFSAVSIYEVGRRYGAGIGGSATPDEEIVLAGVCAAADEASPFFAARDAALAALRGLGYPARFTVRKEPHPELLPGRAADLWAGEERVGVCGELPAAIRRRADCPERVGFFSLDLERLVARLGAAKPVSHRMPNRFPVVEREFTWVCPEALSYGELESVTRQAAGALGVGVELVTIFCGGTVAAGHKAVSLLVRLQAEERTLDEKDLQQVCGKIVKSVEARTPARLRA